MATQSEHHTHESGTSIRLDALANSTDATNHVQKLAPLLIVLDMDETLISRQEGTYDVSGRGRRVNPQYVFDITLPNGVYNHIIKRPGLDAFIQELWRGMAAGEYEVAVFTAAPQSYADAVLNHIDLPLCRCEHHNNRFDDDGVPVLISPLKSKSVLHTRRYEQHTTILPDQTYAKDIAVFNHPLSRTILVDDHSVDAPKLHPDNVIPAPKFNFRYASNFSIAETDNFLPKLTAYIRTLVEVPDVRVPLREKFKISESNRGKIYNFDFFL